jgi:hypothetical protein
MDWSLYIVLRKGDGLSPTRVALAPQLTAIRVLHRSAPLAAKI